MAAITAFSGCSKETKTRVSSIGEKPTVYVVNYPLQYFAERIGSDLISVRFPAPSDEDPAFWRPSGDAIAAYQSADLILLNGASYAKWVGRVSLPKSKSVDTSASFHDRLIQTRDAVTHGHGPGGEHSHVGTAFTTWIDFNQAMQQASAAKEALIELVPDHADQIEANFSSLARYLTALNASMKEVAEQIGDQPLVASHPVYQYAARRYSLNIRAVHWEPDVVPSDEDMADLNKLLAEHQSKWMIWEGEPDPHSIEELKSIGINSVVFDPCGNRPPDETDWLAVMRENVERLAVEFSQQVSSVRPSKMPGRVARKKPRSPESHRGSRSIIERFAGRGQISHARSYGHAW